MSWYIKATILNSAEIAQLLYFGYDDHGTAIYVLQIEVMLMQNKSKRILNR
jgi:hypothetical protein